MLTALNLYFQEPSLAMGPRLLDASGTVLQFSLPLTPRGSTAVGHCAVSLAEPKLWSAEAESERKHLALVWDIIFIGKP